MTPRQRALLDWIRHSPKAAGLVTIEATELLPLLELAEEQETPPKEMEHG